MSIDLVPEKVQLGSLTVPRVWTGLWQLSSNAWGSAPAARVRQQMSEYAASGYTAFDMADHYGSAEILFGQFLQTLPLGHQVVGATKWCIFGTIDASPAAVKAAVDERRQQMQTEQVDLLQFFWQDYSDRAYIPALRLLLELRDEGRIRNLGLCNVDSIRTDEICTELGPGAIVSNQVPFSLIDTRALHGLNHVCERHNIKLLVYGTLCGGFLADRWLGRPEPDLYSGNLTPSQRKYLDVILKAWGDWELFQKLLVVLRSIGDSHGGVSISNVASRWVLDHQFVGAIIVGARLGISDHTVDNSKIFTFALTDKEKDVIEEILKQSNGSRMITTIGDCGAEYR